MINLYKCFENIHSLLFIRIYSSMMSTKTPKNPLYETLPEEVVPGPNLSFEECIENLNNLLKDLPRTDQKKSQSELKKTFYLDKDSLTKKKSKPVREKKTFLTRKERITLNALRLPKEAWKYNELEPMRNMWKQYMTENLEVSRKAPSCTDQDWLNFSTILARSEIIGADVEVIRCKIANQVGMCGTVVLETKQTLQIVTPQSKLRILLKQNCVFQFKLNNLVFTVFGKHLITRPSERSVKKIKSVMMPDL